VIGYCSMINWNDIIIYVNQGNPKPEKRIERSEQEWQEMLSPEQYRITRRKGTEMAFTGEYCHAHEAGKYQCVCCNSPLFDSSIKFDSKSGWPSFTEPIAENAIKYEKDTSFGMFRVEVMCNVCDAHLGHVFPDGPPPSGLRYCINSASIKLT
jgi:peptide-methionine (R)-S-oxide reductase